VRHRDAAERTLLTTIAAGFSPAVLADALLAAEAERPFADSRHSLDFINKAFECLDLIGWEHAAAVLPTVVGQMVAARGAEETTAWRQPRMPCCAKTQASMPIRCWRLESGSSVRGATLTRGGTSSLRLRVILRPIHRPNARRCRRPTSPSA
jgi:hypothetical protein